MEKTRFDNFTRSLMIPSSRRGLVFAGLGGLVARAASSFDVPAVAAKKKRRQKKQPQPVFNQHGCLDVGQPCRGDNSLCCSGVCQGVAPKKGKPDLSTCAAHNAGICDAEGDLCTSGVAARCSATNVNCICLLTTGNAGYCGDITVGGDKLCRSCNRDTDCQAEFGAGAACVSFGGICSDICAATGGTACVPPCA